jgi:hypothetical protein
MNKSWVSFHIQYIIGLRESSHSKLLHLSTKGIFWKSGSPTCLILRYRNAMVLAAMRISTHLMFGFLNPPSQDSENSPQSSMLSAGSQWSTYPVPLL